MSDETADAIKELAYAVEQGLPHDPTADKRMFLETFMQNAGSVEYAADMQGVVAIYKSLVAGMDADDKKSWDAEAMFEEAWDVFMKVKKIQGTGIHHMQPATYRG